MAMRNIRKGQVKLTPFAAELIGAEPIVWLQREAKPGMTLLAHADDGVIWGRVTASGFEFPPTTLWEQAKLAPETLQMARVFDETAEVFLWRTSETSWQARCLVDGQGEETRYFDEPQVLWGTEVEAVADGFARVTEGVQGMRHAPPVADLKIGDWKRNRLRLGVRHYLDDNDDWLRIVMSRLTRVWKE